jgi:UDP-N-acetylmuramate dehydrogenase
MLGLLKLIQNSGIPFETDVKSASYCFYGGGGELKIALFPKTQAHLVAISQIIKKTGAKNCILGGFSNTLIKDGGYSGLAVFTKHLNGFWVHGNHIKCGAGEMLPLIANVALQNSLTGLEALAGIPSSIGGAVVMSAGAYGSEIKDVLLNVTAFSLTNGETKTYALGEIPFAYRTTNGIFGDKIIISATLKLNDGIKEEIEAKMREYKQRRLVAQPREKSLGSVFKNGNGLSAGYFIEKSNLKGCVAGGAKISEKHANFIVNTGGGTASDYIALMELARDAVYGRFGLTLKEEVVVLGD